MIQEGVEMMSQRMRIGEACEYLGIHQQTMRKYVKQGKIPCSYNDAGQRIFLLEDLKKFIGEPVSQEKYSPIFYVRSSDGDKKLIQKQIELLTEKYGEHPVIKDTGSGLNEKRQGLQRLIKLAKKREISHIYITHQDRLTRFGFTYLQELFTAYGVEIHTLNPKKNNTPHEELMQDFMSLIASFSGRFYRMRSKENQRKLIEKAAKEVA